MPCGSWLWQVCIHQTDAKKKAAGIQAIDQFIHRSSTMLILYNEDYFERLWCCFELAARASENAHIVMLPLWRAPLVLAIAVGFTIAHVAEYYCIVAHGVDPPPSSFYVVSLSFHMIPMFFMFETNIRTPPARANQRPGLRAPLNVSGSLTCGAGATRQKTKLAHTLRTFKVANTKCFDPRDRDVVERAISSWFSNDATKRAAGSSDASVDAGAIERFESDVRSGVTNRMIMTSIGDQPGLLRMRELLLANCLVWIPTTCDFAAKNHARGWIAGLAWNAPLFSVAFLFSSLIAKGVLKCFPRCSSWVLVPFLFVATMGTFIPVQFFFLTMQWFVCGEACVFA